MSKYAVLVSCTDSHLTTFLMLQSARIALIRDYSAQDVSTAVFWVRRLEISPESTSPIAWLVVPILESK